MYDYWEFDVATVNPYFGSDSIIPFTKKMVRLLYVSHQIKVLMKYKIN